MYSMAQTTENNYCFAHKFNETHIEFLIVTPTLHHKMTWNGQSRDGLRQQLTPLIRSNANSRLYLVTDGKRVRFWDDFVTNFRFIFQQYVVSLPLLLWQPDQPIEDFEHLIDRCELLRSGDYCCNLEAVFNHHLTYSFTSEE